MRHFDIKKMKRRQFLRLMGSIAATPLMSQFSELAYGAGPFTDYRALVCVFLFGGNDAHNMIVPLDGRYATYAANRGPLALPQADLTANSITDPVQGSFGLHPRMTRTRTLFNAGQLAVVSTIISGARANVIEVHHTRAFASRFGNTTLQLTLETRGTEHVEEILAALRAEGYTVEQLGL